MGGRFLPSSKRKRELPEVVTYGPLNLKRETETGLFCLSSFVLF